MADDLELTAPALVRKIRARTPARLFVGRSGAGYRTATQLELRAAHAAARDAVRMQFEPEEHLGRRLMQQFALFPAATAAATKNEYLLFPERGRVLDSASRQLVKQRCPMRPDLQVLIGDGLSVPAVAAQVPELLPLIVHEAGMQGWSVGQPFAIRHCRVGIMNEIGELLQPQVIILLIGERPGLSTAESLSAYMAYQPNRTHTDADRNLISNIHRRGVPPDVAAHRIIALAARLRKMGRSGSSVKEELPGEAALVG
ncbi:MAG: ethanolamine ammonia-lyase subunit EutC [Acidobacteria bacterium]|nr:ethanolamine ammonia-lyase subunit EutC [Acidobacteriota bacterium]